VLALPPALSPIELDLLLVVVLRLLALRLLVVRLSCPLSLPSLSTSMTAKQVNINTQAHTQLTGSLIAATDTGDKDGNDNGQLSLTIGFRLGIALVDVGYLDIATA
jgi:hypothetical protein